jgi:hypothetical protein
MKILYKKEFEFFKRIVDEDSWGSSYLITGQEGQGKLEFIKRVLLYFICEKRKMCMECRMCNRFKNLNIPDINFVLPDDIEKKIPELYEKGKWNFNNIRTEFFKRSKSIKIQQIHSIEREIYTGPLELKRKFYIFLDADLLTREAQNALLKILEEPPSFVTFFLVTPYPDSILSTIRSRSMSVFLSPLSFEDFKKSFPYSRKDIYFIYRFSEGSIGKGIKIVDEGLVEEYGEFLRGILRTVEEPYFLKTFKTEEELERKLVVFRFFLKDITEYKMNRDEVFRDHPFLKELSELSLRIDYYILLGLFDKYYKLLEGKVRNIPVFFMSFLFDSLRFGNP